MAVLIVSMAEGKIRFLLCKYKQLQNVVIYACKILQKKCFVEKLWPANFALFMFRLITLKQLNRLTSFKTFTSALNFR